MPRRTTRKVAPAVRGDRFRCIACGFEGALATVERHAAQEHEGRAVRIEQVGLIK